MVDLPIKDGDVPVRLLNTKGYPCCILGALADQKLWRGWLVNHPI